MGKVKNKDKTSKDKRPYNPEKKKSKKAKETLKNVKNNGAGDGKENDEDCDDELTIDIVKELGGTEDDLKLLEIKNGDDNNDDDIGEDAKTELKNLIKSLNFSKFTPDTFTMKDEDEELTDTKDGTKDEKPVKKSDSKIQDDEISSSCDPPTAQTSGGTTGFCGGTLRPCTLSR